MLAEKLMPFSTHYAGVQAPAQRLTLLFFEGFPARFYTRGELQNKVSLNRITDLEIEPEIKFSAFFVNIGVIAVAFISSGEIN